MAGSSRGAGRGIALALGDTGATVYVAARTTRDGPKPADGAPGTVEDTAEQVTARGGHGVAVRADCSDDQQVAAQFRFDLSESTEYIGRAAAALAADPEVFRKSGQLLWACDLAKEHRFTDTDGRYIPRFDPKAPQQAYPV